MDRRQFLSVSGLAATAPAFAGALGNSAPADDGLFKRIDFTSDGLGLDPREYSTLLQQAAADGKLQADNYSNGGLIAQLEQTFAGLLGKEAAMFVPTGTLANHIACLLYTSARTLPMDGNTARPDSSVAGFCRRDQQPQQPQPGRLA